MQLHANAALSLNQRRRMVVRVVTLLAGWAYGAIYGSSHERAAALDGWLWTYNHRRPHGSLGHQPPVARLRELNNVPRSYSQRRARALAGERRREDAREHRRAL